MGTFCHFERFADFFTPSEARRAKRVQYVTCAEYRQRLQDVR